MSRGGLLLRCTDDAARAGLRAGRDLRPARGTATAAAAATALASGGGLMAQRPEPRVTRNRHPARRTGRRPRRRPGRTPRSPPPSPCRATSTTSRCASGRARCASPTSASPSGRTSASPRATSSSTTWTSRPGSCPHIRDRAMVMRRYPHGAAGASFFMKRAPSPRPDWIELCSIEHESGNVIDFPMIQDLPSLLWVINLGCIDLNQWYARCDDVDRPDYVHFDLDPVKGKRPVPFERVRETARIVHERRSRPWACPPTPRRRARAASTSTCRSCAGRPRRTSGGSPSASRRDWPRCIPPSSRRSTGSRTGRKAACSWTTTRTPGAAPWPRSTPCARIPRPRSPRPSPGRRSTPASRSSSSPCANVPGRVRETGDLWAPLLSAKGRFQLEKYL